MELIESNEKEQKNGVSEIVCTITQESFNYPTTDGAGSGTGNGRLDEFGEVDCNWNVAVMKNSCNTIETRTKKVLAVNAIVNLQTDKLKRYANLRDRTDYNLTL
jgi:hypothetical protein